MFRIMAYACMYLSTRAIAEAVVSLVRQCWEGGAATSGPVPAAAGRLFLSLTSVLPPSALSGSAVVASLLKDASQVSDWRNNILCICDSLKLVPCFFSHAGVGDIVYDFVYVFEVRYT